MIEVCGWNGWEIVGVNGLIMTVMAIGDDFFEFG